MCSVIHMKNVYIGFVSLSLLYSAHFYTPCPFLLRFLHKLPKRQPPTNDNPPISKKLYTGTSSINSVFPSMNFFEHSQEETPPHKRRRSQEDNPPKKTTPISILHAHFIFTLRYPLPKTITPQRRQATQEDNPPQTITLPSQKAVSPYAFSPRPTKTTH